jgi:cell division protein DivIC
MDMTQKKKIVINITMLVSVLLVVLLRIRMLEVKKAIYRIDGQIIAIEKELQQSNLAILDLQQERDNMESLEYIEKIARQKLGMVKQEDTVFKEKGH